MTYSTLLFPLEDDPRASARLELAIRLARRFDSRLVGLSCRRPAAWASTAEAGFIAMDPLTNELERAAEEAAARESTFLFDCDVAGLARFEVATRDDEPARALTDLARLADLVVLGQANPDDAQPARRRELVDRVVEQSAAPVLVVPYAGRFDTIGEVVLVAWSDDRHCARAVADAMPMLQAARAVHLVTFDTGLGESGTIDASRLDPVVRWLAAHGVTAQPGVAYTRSDIGNALLSRVADVGADLLVMGAWSHSRLSERLFGGVTRTVLDDMTVPVLLSH